MAQEALGRARAAVAAARAPGAAAPRRPAAHADAQTHAAAAVASVRGEARSGGRTARLPV